MIAQAEPIAGRRGRKIKIRSLFQYFDIHSKHIVVAIIEIFRTSNLLNEIQIVNNIIIRVRVGLIIFFSIIILRYTMQSII